MVLLDELGSRSDPTEGMGLAIGDSFAKKSKMTDKNSQNIALQTQESIPVNIEKNEFTKKRIQTQEIKKTPDNPRSMRFNIGDSVMIYTQKMIGIVYQRANEKGEIGVQIKGKKLMINHKRLKLHVPASELYPENYDFSIIFDTVDNRKKKHDMERKHDPNLIIEINNGNEDH